MSRERAADWWAARWIPNETQADFRRAVLKHMPEGDWVARVDYDPQEWLLAAVQEVVPECGGCFFSADGLLPRKTVMACVDGVLKVSAGYGAPWVVVPEEARDE